MSRELSEADTALLARVLGHEIEPGLVRTLGPSTLAAIIQAARSESTPPTDNAGETRDLLPCPFCGPGRSIPGLWFDDTTKRHRVSCGACGVTTGFDPRDGSEVPAITAWNRRADTQQEALTMTDLTVDLIDEAITALIVSGPSGVAAGVNLGRVAGRALKMLHTVVGPQAALVTAETLVANIKAGKIQ
jgi:transcription elongation factor Elf1